MLQIKESVGCAMNGSMTAVDGSGTTSMSEALIGCQPRIDEPSNPSPESKTSSSSSLIGVVKCCHVPRKSRNLKSTATAFWSFASLMASFAVLICLSPLVGGDVCGLQRLIAALAGADAHDLFDRQHEDLAVADATRLRRLLDRGDDTRDRIVLHH